MARQYYCLVAGLREYALDSDHKGFDAEAIRTEILEGVAGDDVRTIELFYTYYDIDNIGSLKAGRGTFNDLGNFSREQLEEEIKKPERLPAFIARVVEAYNNPDDSDYEDIDTSRPLERSLYDAYYKEVAKSNSRFLKQWYEFDRNLRNIGAAYTARRIERSVPEVVVGDGFIAEMLAKSSGADFGLKGEVDYIDQVVAAVDEGGNLIDKEHKVDLIRWNMSDELATFDYFNINCILSYLVKINLVNRWAALDEKRGREMFDKLIASFDGKDLIKAGTKHTE